MINCPRCGSSNWRCWDERTLDWWEKDGSMGGTQVIGCMACNDCNHAFADVNPEDAVMISAGLFCVDEERDQIYRIGW